MAACFIFVESNTTGTGALFVERAAALGYEPVLLCTDPTRYPFLEQRTVTVVRCDTSDPQALRREVAALADRATVAGVFSTSEYFMATAAELARALGLPGADPEAITTCRHKTRQRERLRGVVPVPAFVPVTSVEAISPALRAVPLPVVAKPVSGSGSVGVRLCRSAAEVRAHVTRLLAHATNERGMAAPAEVLLEEYVRGPEYSVEVFNGQAVGVTRKHLSPAPYFVEIGHDFPATLPAAAAASLARIGTAAAHAIGLTWGPAHVELRLAAAGPVVIEINPRLAGGFIPELVRLSTGLDLIEATVALATGLARGTTPATKRHASIRFVTTPEPGIITALRDMRDDVARDGTRVEWYRGIGDRIGLTHDYRDRVGHVVACGPNARVVRARAASAWRRLSIAIDGN
jgi:S-sulfo-L-cysteine synthase (3-phospho-L-serine-dependent)